VLEWLYAREPEQRGEFRAFFDASTPESERELWFHILRLLSSEELIVVDLVDGLWDSTLVLTGRGRDDVERRRERRADRVARATACRTAILTWLYKKPRKQPTTVSDFWTSPYSSFEGLPFKADDVENALGYLYSKDLVWGAGGFGTVLVTAALTGKGDECVERYGTSVPAFLKHAQAEAGLDIPRLMSLVNASNEAIPVLGLDERDAHELRDATRAAAAALRQAKPDTRRITTHVTRITDILHRAKRSTLASVLASDLDH
jgi:hypothetical protein